MPSHAVFLKERGVSYDALGALAQLGERFAGSEEVRSSILLGSTKFPDILSNVLNGLSGIRLPHVATVTNREEVLGHHRVTKIRDELMLYRYLKSHVSGKKTFIVEYTNDNYAEKASVHDTQNEIS